MDFCRCVAICGTAVWHSRIGLRKENHWSNLSQSCIAIYLQARSWICLWGSRLIIWLFFLPGSSNHLRLRWWLRISCTKLIVFDVAIGFFNEKESLCTAILWDLPSQKLGGTRKKEPLTPGVPFWHLSSLLWWYWVFLSRGGKPTERIFHLN
jgi:hypothetical protein